MSPFQRPKVLILTLTEDVAHDRPWADALGDVAEIIPSADGDDRSDLEFDLVVTDLSADMVGQKIRRLVRPEEVPSCGGPKATILGIGPATEGWADVTLGEDCTPREIRLACALLGELARLRNEMHQIAQSHQKIKQVADTDPLTNLPNRRAWDRQLNLEIGRANTTRHPLWLAIVDLDHFKDINDGRGMVEGDQILTHTAQALAGQLREADVIARLGGDEFGVLLAGIDERSALGVFDRLRAAVARQAVETSVGPLTASIGYAGAGENCSAADLFAAAERALRQAKRGGGNRACRGEPQPPSHSGSGPG